MPHDLLPSVVKLLNLWMRRKQWIFDLDFSKALTCSPSGSLYSMLLFKLGYNSLDGWTARCVRSG